jgi:hypothetical protein
MPKHIKEYLPFIWSAMGFVLVSAATFLPISPEKLNLVVNATSGLFGAAFGAATLEKDEGRRQPRKAVPSQPFD